MSERSFGKRIFDVAKANLNAILDRAGAPEALEHLSDEELEAELRRRKEKREREAEEARARESAERAARERAAQRATERAQERAAEGEDAFERIQRKTREQEAEEMLRRMKAGQPASGTRSSPPPRTPPPRSNGASGRASSSSSRKPPSPGKLGEKRMREIYAQLETPYGAPFEEVKKNFRRLMRKYHPDLHAGNPAKHKAATALTASLTQAYNELEQHLTGGRRS